MLPVNSKGKSYEIFEFLLNFDLVDDYLDCPNCEDLACDLIIHLLYAAFSTEQKQKQRNARNENRSVQSDRAQALGLLAMKAASVIEWDLCTMEERIPAVAIGDLLHIFVNQYLDKDRNLFNVDLDTTPDYVTFGIQLVCRWHVRAVIQTNFKKKEDVNICATNIGYDPFKHISQANKSALQNLTLSVDDAVQALERCYLVLRDLIRPVSACFSSPNNDFRAIDIHWEKGVRYPKTDLLAHVAFDLGVYYFVHKRYSEASAFLNNAVELCRRCKSKNSKKYFRDAEAFASVSSAFISTSPSKFSLNEQLDYNRQDLFLFLLEDNRKKKMSIEERFRLEQSNEILPAQQKIIEACNIVYSWIYNDFPLRIPRTKQCPLLGKALQNAKLHFPYCDRLNFFIRLYEHMLIEGLMKNVDSEDLEPQDIPADGEDMECELPSTVRLRKVFTCFDSKNLLFLMGQMTANELSIAKDVLLLHVSLPSFILESLANADPQITTYIIALFFKAFKSTSDKDYQKAQHFLSCSLAFLEDFARVRKYAQCEILYNEIAVSMENVKSGKVDEDLIRRVMGFLNNLPRETDAPRQVVRLSLAFMLTLGHWNFVLSLRRLGYTLPLLEVAITIAKLCLSHNQNDFSQIPNRNREVDKIYSWSLDNCLDREALAHQIEFIQICCIMRHEQALDVIISLLANFSQTGLDLISPNNQLSKSKNVEPDNVFEAFSKILKHLLESINSFNQSRIVLYSDVLFKQSESQCPLPPYRQLIFAVVCHTYSKENMVLALILERLVKLASLCERYFEASFWCQYIDSDEGYSKIYHDICANGTSDCPELIIPYIYDVSMLEFLAAALAEQGSVTLWNLVVHRMQSIECSGFESDVALVRDEKRAKWCQGLIEIMKCNLGMINMFCFTEKTKM